MESLTHRPRHRRPRSWRRAPLVRATAVALAAVAAVSLVPPSWAAPFRAAPSLAPPLAATQEAQRTADAPLGAPAAPFELVASPADARELLIVDGNGRPVAGADVTWFEEAPDGEEALGPEPRLTELRRAFGKTVKSGPDGIARVGEGTPIVVSEGGRYGALAWYREGRRATVTLRPARTLTVRAVDGEQRPVAAAPIDVRARAEPHSPASEWHVVAAADGTAAIAPIDLYADFEAEARVGVHVAIPGPLATPRQQRFTLDELPTAPLELALPATGRMVVEIVDPSGAAIETHGFTSLGRDFRAGEDREQPPWPEVAWHRYDSRGRYEVSHVEVGLRLALSVSKDGWKRGEQIVAGPAKPGETVTVRLALEPLDRVTGRIVDAQRRPLAGRAVTLMHLGSEERLRRSPLGAVECDGDGRFAIELSSFEARFARESESEGILLEAVVLRADGRGVEQSALVRLPKGSTLAGADLGSIELQPSPRLVSGSVVDDAGVPLAGVDLSVMAWPDFDADGGFIGSYGNSGDPVLGTTSGADGRFELWGDAPIGDLDLVARDGDSRRAIALEDADHLRFVAGAQELRVVLWRCGRIEAKVVGDAQEVGDLSLRVGWTRSDGEEGGFAGGLDERGWIDAKVPHGIARFTLERDGVVIARREGIEVAPGAVVTLEPIALDAAAHQCQLTIVDELGQPIERGWVAQADGDEEKRFAEMRKNFPPEFFEHMQPPRRPSITAFTEGRLTLRSDQPFAPFAVGAPGRAACMVRQPAAAERIVLKPVPYVALQLEHDGEPLPAPLEWFASVALPWDDPDWLRGGPDDHFSARHAALPSLDWIALERDAPVELPLRCLGRHRLRLHVGERRPGGHSGTTIDCDLATFDVEESEGDQVFRVRVDRAALDALLAQRAKEQDGGG